MENEKVLIVDDLEEIREILSSFLEDKGYVIYTAENGREALELIKEKEINLVLTDVRMPEMNGYDLTRTIKKMNPKIGIIIMTAYTSIYTEGDIRKIGADDFISKPFNLTNVSEKVERVIFQMKNLNPLT